MNNYSLKIMVLAAATPGNGFCAVPAVAPVPPRLQSLNICRTNVGYTRNNYLQTGLFRDPAGVPALRARLGAAGLAVIVEEASVDAAHWHREVTYAPAQHQTRRAASCTTSGLRSRWSRAGNSCRGDICEILITC